MRALGVVLAGCLLPAAVGAAAPPEKAAPDPASAKTVVWYQMDLPPAYLQPAPDHTADLQTVVDAAVRSSLESKGYSVLWRSVNMDQLARELRSNPHACNGAQLRTAEMETYLDYSIPHSISLAPAAIVRRDRANRFEGLLDARGQLSLQAALAREDLFAGVSAGREFSGSIDAELRHHGESPNLIRRNAMNNSPALLEMVLNGRIDYTLLYPWEANYLAAKVGKGDRIAKFPVQGMAPYVVVVVGCSKGPWGKQVVEIANGAIAALRDTPDYQRLKESWLDEDELRLHRKYRAEAFAAGGTPPAALQAGAR